MKLLFAEAAFFVAAAILLGIVAFYAICCIPHTIFTWIRNLYTEEHENAKMHQSIEAFLKKQRHDDHDFHQMNAW